MLYNLQEGEKGGVRPVGLVYIPMFTKLFPEHISKPLEEAYLNKKDKWIIEETRGRGDVMFFIKDKTAKHFCNDKKYLEIKKKDEKIAYLTLTLGSDWTSGEVKEIYNIINLYKSGLNPEKE
jgi:hypothetical protein